MGASTNPRGLLFVEASHGNLQDYIDEHYGKIDLSRRLKWCSQAAEAVHFIHQHGVIHSDLRPENYLLHADQADGLSLQLCDFGGSTCGAIDGGHLPDSGFFNPRMPWESTETTDIFSLGSVFYTIMTDHWPYRSPGPFDSVQAQSAYCDMVDELFTAGEYPPVEHLIGGTIIEACWMERYTQVGVIIRDQEFFFSAASK